MDKPDPPPLPNALSAAVLETASHLATDPGFVEQRALEILKFAPGQPHVLSLLVAAKRFSADLAGAREHLLAIAQREPNLAAVQYELGLLHAELGDAKAAVTALSRATELEPAHEQAWRVLGEQLAKTQGAQAASEAYRRHLEQIRSLDPALRDKAEELPGVERELCDWVRIHPTDAAARRMLGGVYLRLDQKEEAEKQLRQAITLSPSFFVARWVLARVLLQRSDAQSALAQVEVLLNDNPKDRDYLNFKADLLTQLRRFRDALACHEELLSEYPTADSWMYYGHALTALGRQQDGIVAYRKAIELQPTLGRAYWSLANIKTFRFSAGEVVAMSRLVDQPELVSDNRIQMHFALGKALEDTKNYKESFENYRKANALKRKEMPNKDDISQAVRNEKMVFTPEFLARCSNLGCLAPDPIFIVGLPRSGSTLIEQILASHSQVEGIGEVAVLNAVAQRLANYERTRGEGYPQNLRQRSPEELQAAGEDYLARTRVYRETNRPYFTDKMPSNFHHLGLLLLILPNAKVIDARRHPMAAGFANFKQFYPDAQSFSFDLMDIGHYYRNYVELMAHFDSVLPGRVHRIFYEKLVLDTETEIRKLLDYCRLPFEEACLGFYENRRGVLTASSAQVRRPIFKDSLEQWRHYESWLEPLKSALGDVLTEYPQVPVFPAAALSPRPVTGFTSSWSYRIG